MSWLKRIEPIVISQTSDVPYVILEDGVYMCYNNLFYEGESRSDYYLKFNVSKSDLIQKSTNCLYLKYFPTFIPFKDIIALDDTVVNGRIIKIADTPSDDSKNILVVRSESLRDIEDKQFQEFVEQTDSYDQSFLLTSDEIDPQDRLLDGIMNIINHKEWYKTCTSILDHIIESNSRKYCWTKSAPEFTMEIHGMDSDEHEEISDCFDNLGVSEKELIWA